VVTEHIHFCHVFAQLTESEIQLLARDVSINVLKLQRVIHIRGSWEPLIWASGL
jgi:hypothetical protein